MVLLGIIALILISMALVAWLQAADGDSGGAIIGGMAIVLLFGGLVGAVTMAFITSPDIKSDNIRHTEVRDISKVVYLATSGEYLVDIELGNGVDETVRVGKDSDVEVKMSDRNQLVHREMIYDNKRILWWEWTYKETSILLIDPKTIEIKEGM